MEVGGHGQGVAQLRVRGGKPVAHPHYGLDAPLNPDGGTGEDSVVPQDWGGVVRKNPGHAQLLGERVEVGCFAVEDDPFIGRQPGGNGQGALVGPWHVTIGQRARGTGTDGGDGSRDQSCTYNAQAGESTHNEGLPS